MNALGHVGTLVWFKAPIRRPSMAPYLNEDVNTNIRLFVSNTIVCDLDNDAMLMQTSVMRDKEIYQLLGQQIAARRRGLKMTQSKLAAKVGISRASIANIEGGRQNVLLHHLYRFAEALNMSEVAELLPVTVKPSRANDEFLGVSFSDENISEKTKALMSNLVSRALSQRKVKP